MIFKGFKFGMILQLAVGPVCLFVFKLASSQNFFNAETAVLAVTIVDTAFILLAIMGITSLIEKENVKIGLKILGAVIVAAFGINTMIEILGWNIIPNIRIMKSGNGTNSFINGLILTASNPLTILFWAGVFSSKIAESRLVRKDIYLFGLGSIMATLFFLTLIAVIGSYTRHFFTAEVIKILNLFVGMVLIYFAVKMVFKKG